jgi:hypothetical protein
VSGAQAEAFAQARNLQTENFRSKPRPSRRGFTSSAAALRQSETKVTTHVNPQQASSIRQVLLDAEDALQALDLDGCDVSDVQEIIDKALAELDHPTPNVATLGTYLNSIARSLRSQSGVRTVVMELDAAMRDANVATTWEH